MDESTGKNSTIQSDIILGSDGAFSPVRLAMQTKTDMFNFSQTYLEHAYKELVIPADENGGFKMEKNALHIWPRKNFMMIALPNLDGSFTCTLFFQLKGEESFESVKTENDLTAFFKKYFADAMPMMPTLQHDFFNNPTSTLVTVRCFPWSFEDKACLLGDAAHAIVPFFGQGMNCGFEDCVVFDEMMGKHGDNWKALFEEFQQIRKPNGDAVAQLALDNFIEMRDKTGDPKFLLRKKIEGRIAAEHPNFLSMYAQVTFNPQISYHTAYHEGQRHNIHLEKLTNIENVFDKWSTDEVQNVVKELVG
jgi:kynurenine 3-monooxygenase